jgi:hypothetical protein
VKSFLPKYKNKFCEEVNLELAPPCPKFDKGFRLLLVWPKCWISFYSAEIPCVPLPYLVYASVLNIQISPELE